MKGIQENKNQIITIDLGDSRLLIRYTKELLTAPTIQFSHSYNNALYQSKISQKYAKKNILKLFKKQ